MIEKLYTVEEVAELASVTGRTIRNYLKSGRLVGRKIGGQWRFPEAEVQRLLNGAPPDPLYAHVQDTAADMPERIPEPPDDDIYAQPGAPAYTEDAPKGAYMDTPTRYAMPEPAQTARYAPQQPVPQQSAPMPAAPAYQPQPQPVYTQPYAGYPQYEPQPVMAELQAPPVQYMQPQTQPAYMEPNYVPQPAPVYQPVAPLPPAQPLQQPVAGTPIAQQQQKQQQVMPYAYTVQPTIPLSSPPSPSVTRHYPAQVAQPVAVDQGVPSAEPVFNLDSLYRAEPTLPQEPISQVPGAYPHPEPEPVADYSYQPEPPPVAPPPYQPEPQQPVSEPAAPADRTEEKPRETDLLQNFSEVGKRVARFVAEVHDASDGPVMCSVIDVSQNLEKARHSSERISAMAEEESEGGTLCQSFVEYDDRYSVARYTLFGTSIFLRRCVELISEPPASPVQ